MADYKLTDEEKATIAAAEERIGKARAQRAALSEQREAQKRIARVLQEAEAEEQAGRDDETCARLEAEHGKMGEKIARVDTAAGMVVVRRPQQAVFRRWQSKRDDSLLPEHLEKLVFDSLLYPSKADFGRMLEELPGIIVRTADAVIDLAGVGKKNIEGK